MNEHQDAATLPHLPPGRADEVGSRGAERYRRIGLSAATAAIARATSLGVSLVSVPLAFGYLGAERFGMWVTITSLVAILGSFDLGLGNGLRQIVAAATGRDDHELARRATSTALPLLAGVGFIILVAFAVSYPIVPWADVFNASGSLAVSEAGPSIAVLVIAVAMGIPLAVPTVVQSAYQVAYISNLWSIAASLLSLILLGLAIAAEAGLPALVAALLLGASATGVANMLLYFRRQNRAVAPTLRGFSRPLAITLLGSGAQFAILQVAATVGYQIDNLVIAQVLGAEHVAEFAIPMRLFSIPPLVVGFAIAPLWPAYREALTRGDHAWVRKTLRASIFLSLGIGVPASAALLVASQAILSVWVGNAVNPSWLLLVGLAAWSVIYGVSIAIAMLLNAINAIRFQIRYAILMATSNLALSVILVERIGVEGAILGSVVAQSVFILVPYARALPRLLTTGLTHP